MKPIFATFGSSHPEHFHEIRRDARFRHETRNGALLKLAAKDGSGSPMRIAQPDHEARDAHYAVDHGEARAIAVLVAGIACLRIEQRPEAVGGIGRSRRLHPFAVEQRLADSAYRVPPPRQLAPAGRQHKQSRSQRASCAGEISHHAGLEMLENMAVEHPFTGRSDERDLDAFLRENQNCVGIVDGQRPFRRADSTLKVWPCRWIGCGCGVAFCK